MLSKEGQGDEELVTICSLQSRHYTALTDHLLLPTDPASFRTRGPACT